MAALSLKVNRFGTCIGIIYFLTIVRAVVYVHVIGIVCGFIP